MIKEKHVEIKFENHDEYQYKIQFIEKDCNWWFSCFLDKENIDLMIAELARIKEDHT